MSTNPQSPRKSIFVSLRWKLLVGFSLVFTLVFAGAFLWFYNFTSANSMARIEEDLISTLSAATSIVNGDQLEGLINEGIPRESDGYTNDPRFWSQVDQLGLVFTIEPRSRPFIYIQGDQEDELIFVASGCTFLDPSNVACPRFMQKWITNNPGPNLGGLVQTTLQDQHDGCPYLTSDGDVDQNCKLSPYKDDFGEWVSAFAPIKNSKGEVIAAMGMDFEASYVSDVQQAIQAQTIITFLIVYAFLFILVFSISEIFTRPIRSLTRAANFISQGEYEKSLGGLDKGSTEKTFSDEIGQLSRMFQLMIDKVYQRELSLRKQVEERQIIIDEVKRQKQVSEIIDTDIFHDLEQKSRLLHQRRNPKT